MRKKNGRIFDPLRYNSPKNVLEETYNKAVLECEWYLGDTIQVPRELWEKVKSDIEFYASINRADDPGSWDMRKRFVFDLIRSDDLDSAGYEDQPKGKYYFGGKRARSSLEAIKKAGL